MPGRELIQIDKLFISPFLPDDSQDLFEYLSDPQIYRYKPGEPTNVEQVHIKFHKKYVN